MTRGRPASIIAAALFVVPRSMPRIFSVSCLLLPTKLGSASIHGLSQRLGQVRPLLLAGLRGGARYSTSSRLPFLSRPFFCNSQNRLEDTGAGGASPRISPSHVLESPLAG